MNDPIYVFEAVNSTDYKNFLLSLGVATVLLLVSILLYARRKKSSWGKNRMLAAAMFCFFIFLIAGSTAWFSYLSFQKLSAIKIYADSITTPYGASSFEDILKASLEDDEQTSMVNRNITLASTRLLIIEEKKNKTQVISEKNYDVEAVFAALREQIETWREGNK